MSRHRLPRSPLLGDEVLMGCDWNPEQWPESVWEEDVELMSRAGVGLVAVNVFGWSDLQPRPGAFEPERLDRVVDLLHRHGIGVNLGTGTASPPPWLSTAHPEILPVAVDGTTRWPGGRQAWCPSSPVFREHAVQLAEQVAARYGHHPGVRLWHVSNELGCHNALCYCDVSAEAFRGWLERRYTTLEALNDAWGTSFWSQRYGAWDQVLPPRANLSAPNPGQVLDFQRFSSAELLDHYRAEAEVIRTHSDLPVTTNLMVTAHQRDVDNWAWAPHLEVVANDHYLDHRLEDPVGELAFSADATRGLAGGAPWLLMEHSTSAVNWQEVNVAKVPGELLRTSAVHLARGADALCFFQWRASVQGAEKYHSAMLPHAGTGSRTWREVTELGALLPRLTGLAGTVVRHQVALVFSWENQWAADGTGRPSTLVQHLDQVLGLYRAARAAGVNVDVVAPGASLEGYRAVLVPHLHLVRDTEAAVLADFVAAGGHALITFFSGIVDADDRVRPGPYPGAFRDLLGVEVDQVHPLPADQVVRLSDGGTGRLWTEELRTTSATAVQTYLDGPLPGTPAVTRRGHGAGAAWYAATRPDHASATALVRTVLEGAGVTPVPGAGEDVDVVRRTPPPGAGGTAYTFVVNHRSEPVQVPLHGREVLTGEQVAGPVTVPAGAVRIVAEEVG